MTASGNNLPPLNGRSFPGRFGVWCARLGIHPRGLSVPATLALFAVLLAAVAAYAVVPAVVATGSVLVLIAATAIAAVVGPLIVTRQRHGIDHPGLAPVACAGGGSGIGAAPRSPTAVIQIRLRPDGLVSSGPQVELDDNVQRAWADFVRALGDIPNVLDARLTVTHPPRTTDGGAAAGGRG